MDDPNLLLTPAQLREEEARVLRRMEMGKEFLRLSGQEEFLAIDVDPLMDWLPIKNAERQMSQSNRLAYAEDLTRGVSDVVTRLLCATPEERVKSYLFVMTGVEW